jgi:DNA-directed RNA polymerase
MLLPSLSSGAPPLPHPTTEGFDWLDLFAFLSSPADSYQIP